MPEPSRASIPMLFGEMPNFPARHFLVASRLPVPQKLWPGLTKASLSLADWLVRKLQFSQLQTAASAVRRATPDGNPVAVWLDGLLLAFGISARPVQVSLLDDTSVQIRLPIRYPEVTTQLVSITEQLLATAASALARKQSSIDLKRFQRAFEDLARSVPDVGTLAFHAALWKHRLPWRWSGGATLVGFGSCQRRVETPPGDFDAQARQLLSAQLPIYTVTGSIGKTTTVRLLSQILGTSGLRIGFTASDGGWAAGRQVMRGDCIGGKAAEDLLDRNDIDAAILEVGRGGIIKQGIPYPRSDVAILLNLHSLHLEEDGVGDLEALADVKAQTLIRAETAVLNADDPQCSRVSKRLPPENILWFSRNLGERELCGRSLQSKGAVGVSRDRSGEPVSLDIWRKGERQAALSLIGVRPFHGMLGEKTVEELCAAVAAAWFGPVQVKGWEAVLPTLALDESNHAFRSSLHPRGNALFLLDKASNPIPLKQLGDFVGQVIRAYGIRHRIGVLTRPAGLAAVRYQLSCEAFYPLADEFVCFDVARAGTPKPQTDECSVSLQLKEEFERLNRETGIKKPIATFPTWRAAQAALARRLPMVAPGTLVIVNQPSTKRADVNQAIIAFVNSLRKAGPQRG
jgi:hypothetical protein